VEPLLSYKPKSIIPIPQQEQAYEHMSAVDMTTWPKITCVNDAYILCENFVKFFPVTPELTELMCERHIRHGQKTGAFSRISPDILDRFS